MVTGRADRIPVVAGVGESRFARQSDEPLAGLLFTAIESALDDARLDPTDITAICTDSHVMPHLLPPDLVQAALGCRDVRLRATFGQPGSSHGQALIYAAQAIASGEITSALIYFGVNWGSAANDAYAFHDRYETKTRLEYPYGFFGQPTYFALIAKRYAHVFNLTDDDLSVALGAIAVEQRSNARRNANAQTDGYLSFEEYLNGRMIADPLRVNDCCLLSDGAVALVVTSLEQARSTDRQHHAALLGGSFVSTPMSDDSFFTQSSTYPEIAAAKASRTRAFASAGITPDDLDFAEIYDCFSIAVLLQLEQLGVCAPGEGSDYLKRTLKQGAKRGGRLPINTHGGLLSQAYIVGINHYSEAVRQIRGEAGAGQVDGAEVGVVSAGPNADHSTVVFGRTR